MYNYNEVISIKNFMNLYDFSKEAILYLKNQAYNGEITIEVYRNGYDDNIIKKIFSINFYKNEVIEVLWN
jgi:RNA-binding protein YhbY